MGRPAHTPETFWARVRTTENEDDCWPWGGPIQPYGSAADFGRVGYKGVTWIPCRLAYVLAYGPIPKGTPVHHTCKNPACCNPKHLYIEDKGA